MFAMKEAFLLLSILLLSILDVLHGNTEDRFNYRGTVGTDFGPEDWSDVECDDVGECPGWPDDWELGVGWKLERNNCVWCPEDEEGGNDCGQHRQSPIDLKRERSTTGNNPECFDYHWMAYQDGSCKWHDIVKNRYAEYSNNFKIERHSLQILQPIDENEKLRCDSDSGRLFPRLDYSKGFSDWWFLSHTELTVPSEHTQEGKRYDAEVHLAHFYSVKSERKIGKVTLFLEADPGRERWDFLDKLICQWRETEEQTRDECGLGTSDVPAYPGCRNPTRAAGESDLPKVDPYPFIDCDSVVNSDRICKPSSCCEARRSTGSYCEDNVYGLYGEEDVGSICWWCCPGKLLTPAPDGTQKTAPRVPRNNAPTNSTTRLRRKPHTRTLSSDPQDKKGFQTSVDLSELEEATDVLLPGGRWASELVMDPENFEVSVDLEDEYLGGVEDYRRRQAEVSKLSDARRISELTGDNYINVKYSPYQWMREVRTEYYYRYEGTQMVPPCYETVHYRVMKDAIRIHPDQLKELERLLAMRIAPKGSEFNECQRDTAGKERPGSGGKAVDLNRPLQSYNNLHTKVFCECGDWDSKFQEDKDWCELDQETRFYEQPYNYPSGGKF